VAAMVTTSLLVVPPNLVGEIDTPTGGIGADLFVLGMQLLFCGDDRNKATAGRGDYALVTDFNNDVIQLKSEPATTIALIA